VKTNGQHNFAAQRRLEAREVVSLRHERHLHHVPGNVLERYHQVVREGPTAVRPDAPHLDSIQENAYATAAQRRSANGDCTGQRDGLSHPDGIPVKLQRQQGLREHSLPCGRCLRGVRAPLVLSSELQQPRQRRFKRSPCLVKLSRGAPSSGASQHSEHLERCILKRRELLPRLREERPACTNREAGLLHVVGGQHSLGLFQRVVQALYRVRKLVAELCVARGKVDQARRDVRTVDFHRTELLPGAAEVL
jgi:hypothetical protein